MPSKEIFEYHTGFGIAYIMFGMLPMSLFSDISNICKEHNFPIDGGMEPLRRFPWISRGVSLTRRVIEVGTGPVNLLLKRSKTLKYLRLSKISRILSLGNFLETEESNC